MSNVLSTIKKIYFDPAGYGSIQQTYNESRKLNASVKLKDVQDFMQSLPERNKSKMKGSNSFIPTHALQEIQLDIMFINKEPALIGIDIFTKFIHVVLLENKNKEEYLRGIKAIIAKIGKPEMFYSDEEGVLHTPLIKNFMEENNILLILTRSHASFVERAIRTIKDMIHKRLEHVKVDWKDLLFQVVLTYNYKMVNSSTGFTPKEATKQSNHIDVRANLELHRKHTRNYPFLNVGDKVRILYKKDKLDKEHVSNWSKDVYVIYEITKKLNQTFFILEGKQKLYLRHELLLVRN
jgi:hypothetical protein